MFVVKRNGEHEPVFFDKITRRLQILAKRFNLDKVDTPRVTMQVMSGLHNGIKTSDIDQLTAETCVSMQTEHPQYEQLGSALAISNHHKMTSESFSKTIQTIPSMNTDILRAIEKYADELDSMIQHDRDYQYGYFGFKTLLRSYLLRVDGKVVERPQYMLMRVACELHLLDDHDPLSNIQETYDALSRLLYTHATPTLFNSCMTRNQLASCFLLSMKEDSIDGIFDTLGRCAGISKSAGGIGLAIHNVRAKDSPIYGTNGISNGIVPMLKVFESTARYVDQGGSKRKGSFACYLEPWHADILDFLELRKNNGKEELRARDLFYGLWIPDLFMRRVKEGGVWSLFSPPDVGYVLSDCYGSAFDETYTRFESEHKYVKQLPARDLFKAIITAQIETGLPYMLYKDQCNRCSNQNNLGTIKSSNLCCEIIEYTDGDTTAVCNLASINLSKFVKDDGTFDFDGLRSITRLATRNLNRVIDRNYYPDETCTKSNRRDRPIGIGVQGLADVFIKLNLSFTDPRSKHLNKRIFEHMYYASLMESNALARKDGVYHSYQGSMLQQGKLHMDVFNPSITDHLDSNLDWKTLRQDISTYGVRNSLLVALMPTASTAQIMGNYESFEPIPSNLFVRSVLAGEFIVINKYLVADLEKIGMWNKDVKDSIVSNNGSIQHLNIDPKLKEKYKTIWEIKQKDLVDMAIDRSPFVDQSQSFNVHFANPEFNKIYSYHLYAWSQGMKTGSYYVRTQAAVDPVKFTIQATDKTTLLPPTSSATLSTPPIMKCSMDEGCWSCSS
jgi:ribonucleoside-diphosphate reductase alpha subunit